MYLSTYMQYNIYLFVIHPNPITDSTTSTFHGTRSGTGESREGLAQSM